MIAVIFEVVPAPGRKQQYLDLAAALKKELSGIDGFFSVERFQSLTDPDKMLSLSFFRDEEAVKQWRNTTAHRATQRRSGAAEVAYSPITGCALRRWRATTARLSATKCRTTAGLRMRVIICGRHKTPDYQTAARTHIVANIEYDGGYMRFPIFLAAAAILTPSIATAQQVFDSHVHLPDGEKSLREYEAQVKAAGIDEVGFGGMWFGGPNLALAGNPARIRASNDAHLALAKKHPEMLPIATVHPYDGAAALAEVTRVAGLGFKVLKLHPHTQKFDPADPRVLAVVTRAGELGMIVLMDNFNVIPGDSEKLFNLALQAPKTKFIFAHLGGMNFRFWNVIRAARTAKGLYADNIYFDIAATTVLLADSPINDEFVWTIRSVGVDHVLLGSDYPQFTLKQTLDAFEKLNLTPDEKNKIRYENARSLFGLKP